MWPKNFSKITKMYINYQTDNTYFFQNFSSCKLYRKILNPIWDSISRISWHKYVKCIEGKNEKFLTMIKIMPQLPYHFSNSSRQFYFVFIVFFLTKSQHLSIKVRESSFTGSWQTKSRVDQLTIHEIFMTRDCKFIK